MDGKKQPQERHQVGGDRYQFLPGGGQSGNMVDKKPGRTEDYRGHGKYGDFFGDNG
jgi:hypothetical protein